MMASCGGILLVMAWICIVEFHPYKLMIDAASTGGGRPVVIQIPQQRLHSAEMTSHRKIAIVGDDFMLDGKRLQIISGSVHYFRMPAEYWRDRLKKLKAAGFNAVSTYVEWSHHEPEWRQYRFEGDYDVARFVQLAAEEGLLVLLRPGPYICAERDLGGLPYWLLHKYSNMKLRTTDPDFLRETSTWFGVLFGKLTSLLYGNGGPIILVQVENEYGSYSNKMAYKEQLRDIMKEHVNDKALLYTTDGTTIDLIRGGMVPGAHPTIDFGVGQNLRSVFQPLRSVLPTGPLMNSEFYPGWLTHWGETLQQVSTDRVVNSLKSMIDNKINVNMYVFYGGSNFEFSSGANFIDTYLPDLTSYDYDAPLSEAGDPTPKYYAIRSLMEKYDPHLKNTSLPMPGPKGAYGKISIGKQLNLLSAAGRSSLGRVYQPVSNEKKLPTFERLGQRAGFLLYETTLPGGGGLLNIPNPRDRIYAYLDGVLKGIIDRQTKQNTLWIHSESNSVLSLLVENQGRINYGQQMHDYKGILGVVKFQDQVLVGRWNVTGFPLDEMALTEIVPDQPPIASGPLIYTTDFTLPAGVQPLDTFIDSTGWGKGYIWVNGHNLGRYWPARGPQVTLYLPGVWLHAAPAHNTIHLLELEKPADDLNIEFIDYPILNRTFY